MSENFVYASHDNFSAGYAKGERLIPVKQDGNTVTCLHYRTGNYLTLREQDVEPTKTTFMLFHKLSA